uniref:Protein Vpr n=1 Tax=Human immunodeficiency virus type 1 TaxID=11676 RepID=A0A088DP79_HV1|nr:vpr protein [Human immunodeficiency virus 1]
MEQAPEDQGPQREPYNEWTLELLEEWQSDMERHSDRLGPQNLGQHIYETYGDTWARLKTVIKVPRQSLVAPPRIGCRHSRIGVTRQRRARNGASRS